jgi:hypothetical protein
MSSIVKKKSHALKKIKVMLNRVGRPESSVGNAILNHEASSKLVLPGIAPKQEIAEAKR